MGFINLHVIFIKLLSFITKSELVSAKILNFFFEFINII